MNSCRICGNAVDNRIHVAKESHHGTWEEFEYLECGHCGCLQIEEIPPDLASQYSEDYYSFKKRKKRITHICKLIASRIRARICLKKGSLLGRLYRSMFHEPTRFRWFRAVQLGFDSKVLDVGCGTGGILLNMHMDGFRDLTGIDKFVDKEVELENRVRIIKGGVFDIDSEFRFILLNHTFEHLTDPLPVLRHLYRILRPGGYVLLRMPVAGSYAWREYGTQWVELSPPVHIHIFSEKGVGLIAREAGFVLESVEYDSRSVLFWGSEQIRRGIPLFGKESYGVNPRGSIFTRRQIAEFKKRAEDLNRSGEGDQACFYLRKPGEDR